MMHKPEPPPHLHGREPNPFKKPIAHAGVDLGAPTPLDAYRVFTDSDDGRTSYIHDAQSRTLERIKEAGEAIGLPDVYQQCVERELDAALDVRVARNEASYRRLLEKIGDTVIDDEVAAIIQKARAGAASASELLRLVKENPEMISIEFFKRQPLFDNEQYMLAAADLTATLYQVQSEFYGAEISLLANPITTAQPFVTEHGALVWKEKIGDCRTHDSHSEIIAKHTMLALPPAVQLHGVKSNHIKINEQVLNLLPLSMSAYFRAADYKDRAGYVAPEDEIRYEITPEFMQKLGHHAAILENIPPEMWGAYLSTSILDLPKS